MSRRKAPEINVYRELRNTTIPRLLLERAGKTPREVAFRAKKLGIYQERTWMELLQSVSRCAMGLMELGLGPGERLALMGDPCEEYVICELAAHALGAITYGIYPTCPPHELHDLMKEGGACVFVAQNQEYLDRVLPFFDQLSDLGHIVVIDTKGMFVVDHPSLISYEKLLQNGEQSLASRPGVFEEMVQRVKPSDGIFIVYTSGTTGPPKGVLISHGKHLAAACTLIDRYPILAETDHRTVACIPLSHILGKIVTITLPLLTRIVPHYGEDMEILEQTMFDIAPAVLFVMPKYLRKLASRLFVSMENSSPLKKASYGWALKTGHRHLRNVWDGQKSPWLRFSYFISYHVAFRPILNKLGFDKLKIVFSTGTPLPPGIMAFWQMCGVNLSEFYGLTEAGGAAITAQGGDFPHPGDVGKPSPGWEVKLSNRGEILVRGEDLFEGYRDHPELTRETLSPDGWFHTGDGGEFDSHGNLKLLDRPQDFILVRSGEKIGPTHIENSLRAIPYISEAVVFGDHCDYLSCLIEIDFEALSDWATRNNILFMGFAGLIQHPEIIRFLNTEIEKVNQGLLPHERVKAFRIIPKELNPAEDGSPVTPMRKIKRQILYEKFRETVESMYPSTTPSS